MLRDAPPLVFPAETDCNSPAHWDGDTFYLFNSAGKPKRSSGPDVFHLGWPRRPIFHGQKVAVGDHLFQAG
jgi:hypothetical protein